MAKRVEFAHCCSDMTKFLNEGDLAITFIPEFREYGIGVLNGGTAIALVQYCPWCGKLLPSSLRDQWFEELESMGITEPNDSRIPPKYLTAEWWLEKEK